MDKITITEDLNESYKELKDSLKEKYTKILHQAVYDAQEIAVNKVTDFLNHDIIKLIEQTEELKQTKKEEEKSFYKSKEYISVQNSIKKLKRDLDSSDDGEKEKIENELNKKLAEITTLNITIKNRLKSVDESISINTLKIDQEIDIHSEELDSLKKEVTSFLQQRIVECLKNYNLEIIKLNQTFGIENSKEPEIPFEGNVLKLDVPFFNFGNPKNVRSVDCQGEEKTLIYSEDKSNTVN